MVNNRLIDVPALPVVVVMGSESASLFFKSLSDPLPGFCYVPALSARLDQRQQEQKRYPMSKDYNHSLQDRLNVSVEAKKRMLEKFKKAQADDSLKVQRQREREEIVAKRAERAHQREAARQRRQLELANEAAILAEKVAEAERVAREQAEQAERMAEELVARKAAERVEHEMLLQAADKAIRDDRYAARKATKKARRREP